MITFIFICIALSITLLSNTIIRQNIIESLKDKAITEFEKDKICYQKTKPVAIIGIVVVILGIIYINRSNTDVDKSQDSIITKGVNAESSSESNNNVGSESLNLDGSYRHSSDANPCIISEDYIKQDLYNPKTASFSSFDCSSEENADGTYTVLRKVSASNKFGVESEFIYKLKLGFKGGIWVDMNNWELISIRSEEYR